jgi:hypothetical protein
MVTLSRAATLLRVFGAPMLLALVSAIGLISALLGDSIWDVLSWLALATPIAVIMWYVALARMRG